MIVVQAHMYPMGDPTRAYELLHATIANRADNYFAHVLVRPWAQMCLLGREVDLTISGFKREQSADRLIEAVLHASNRDEPGVSILCGKPGYRYEVHKRANLSIPQHEALVRRGGRTP